MKAAVVTTFSKPPRYQDFADPTPAGEHDEVVDVLASGLHPRVRSQADGSHYTATDDLPLIPGVDGVGRRADGTLVYFVLSDTAFGAMAEKTVVDRRRSVALPADADPILVAALMNPAMSSWVALKRRVTFEPGQSVLILGATGSAGRVAVQVAARLGAASIVVAGRGASRLDELRVLGATEVVDLSASPEAVAEGLAEKAGEVDVVLDYLWGAPAESAFLPLVTGRADRSRSLTWIQIGSVAGAEVALPSAVLRQANIRFVGSGQGSVSARGIVEELPALVAEIGRGTFDVDSVAVPLAEVEQAWNGSRSCPAQRVVLVP